LKVYLSEAISHHHAESRKMINTSIINKIFKLSFANGGLGVMAGNVVELDTVIVEVVENSQAKLITFTVIGLGNATSVLQ
jgi:hypothetical protein